MLGCGQIKTHRGGSRELASIAVTPEYQRRGVGSAIVSRLLSRARPPIYLTCRASLGAYYARFGFEPTSANTMPVYFRLVRKLAGLIRKCFPNFEELLVMIWRG